MVTRSREDQEAIRLPEDRTQRVDDGGVRRYATPLLRKSGAPKLKGSIQSVTASLRSTEKRLKKDPEKAAVYSAEIAKLAQAGYVTKLQPEEVDQSEESWYLPHQLVHTTANQDRSSIAHSNTRECR